MQAGTGLGKGAMEGARNAWGLGTRRGQVAFWRVPSAPYERAPAGRRSRTKRSAGPWLSLGSLRDPLGFRPPAFERADNHRPEVRRVGHPDALARR